MPKLLFIFELFLKLEIVALKVNQSSQTCGLISYISLFDPNGNLGLIVSAGGDRRDFINDLDYRYDLSECGILSVKVRRILVHDEELT